MMMYRAAIIVAVVALGVATFSNGASLSVIGAREYLEHGAGGDAEEGEVHDLGDLTDALVNRITRLRDSLRRRMVDRHIRDADWTQYTPYPPGIPSLMRKGPITAEEAGYSGIQDERYVVFYRPGVSHSEARAVLDHLGSATGRVSEVLGSVPEQVHYKGRKIVVYLPAEEFDALNREWGSIKDAAGFCSIVWDASLRPYLAGIYIAPEVVRSEDYLPVVLTHELAHFAFEVTRNVRNRVVSASWFSEGLAEYTAQNVGRLREIPARLDREHSLIRRSPPAGDWAWRRDDYWMGLSAFLVVDTGWGERKVAELVEEAREWSTHEAFDRSGVPLSTLEQAWLAALPTLRREGLAARQ